MKRFLKYLEEQSQFSYATPEQMRDKSGKYLFHVTSKARAKNIVGGGNPEIVTQPISKGSRRKVPVGVSVQKGEGLKAPGMQRRGGNWGQDVSRLQSVFVTGQKGLGHWQRQVAGSRFSSYFKNYQDEQMGKEAEERSGRVALAVAPETSGEQADVDKIGGIATVKIPIANIPKNVRRRIRIDRSGSRLASKEQELLGAVPGTYGDRKPTADDLKRQKRRESGTRSTTRCTGNNCRKRWCRGNCCCRSKRWRWWWTLWWYCKGVQRTTRPTERYRFIH